MAVLTVVFQPHVPRAERERLLAGLKNLAVPDEGEADGYGVQVPDAMQWELAHRYADLEYQGRPAVSRVSWTRLRREVENVS